ncbi:hypothetical protein B5G34_11875 [Flavonifractor sp. An82]|uniref:YoaK family protein n=1 Tax=Flavonifractor sp. An82 TaxID=1965660 RepID=UPI000B55F955|nr:YoaK family protein [Flavonifractor sp. An82]OUN21276.1 hypothetical protein B5G34_11875 [Flavonifractor sp. An82]
METEEFIQMSERFRIGALLALTGGLLDAYTYVMRGGVFANAQTGNIVLLGVRMMEGDWSGMAHSFLPIVAFVAGVIAAEFIRERCRRLHEVHWRQVTVGLELAVLVLVSFLPQALNGVANVAVSFVCAVQVESFRKVRGSAFATTMCTGNLRSGTEQFYQFLRTARREHLVRAARYGGIILFFIAGAALGAWCSGLLGLYTAAVGCVPLLMALCLMCFQKNPEDFEKSP